ncbi:MAG TPA: RdgB/HAM1 family non-canonical purine NTP pyrophosphatase [Bryobacteraceae bacterium]|nr:RdgB/HAM1 family non-canonical purine NTP pyrophosphatase [Bryobacteraceae bacterium]
MSVEPPPLKWNTPPKPAEPLRLCCATSNPGKLREFRLAAGERGPLQPVEIELLENFHDLPAAVEDGETFGANAMIKASHYSRHRAGLVFADDSGLMVDALEGAPGVYSARFSGPGATDESNNRLLLEKMKGVEDRRAHFVCLIALAQQGRILGLYAGSVSGAILKEPRGSGGFGYDPLFFYEPLGKTFGELDDAAKFSVSHRGQALRRMLKALAR